MKASRVSLLSELQSETLKARQGKARQDEWIGPDKAPAVEHSRLRQAVHLLLRSGKVDVAKEGVALCVQKNRQSGNPGGGGEGVSEVDDERHD